MASSQHLFTKQNVSFHEFQMYKYIYDLSKRSDIHILNILHVPFIFSYNIDTQTLVTERIQNINVFDFYGDAFLSVDNNVIDKIREIVTLLYKNQIVFPDITGNNFIEHRKKLWIVDFEHSHFALLAKVPQNPYCWKGVRAP
jgi:hypothetical protein